MYGHEIESAVLSAADHVSTKSGDLCQVTRSYLGASLPHSTAYENEAYISDSCWLVYEACYEVMHSVSTSGSEQIV